MTNIAMSCNTMKLYHATTSGEAPKGESGLRDFLRHLRDPARARSDFDGIVCIMISIMIVLLLAL